MGKSNKKAGTKKTGKSRGNGQANGLPPKAPPADKKPPDKKPKGNGKRETDEALEYMADTAVEIALRCMRVRNVTRVREAVNVLYPVSTWSQTTARGRFTAAMRRVIERRIRG